VPLLFTQTNPIGTITHDADGEIARRVRALVGPGVPIGLAIVLRTSRGEVRPVQALETPPLVINIVKQFSGEEPMRSLIDDVEQVTARRGTLSASVVQGYPYAGVAEMGMSFLVVHDGDAHAAGESARWLARRA
jgi:microcystin degradation protein MlrC